jgi:hypothetical protein
LARLGEGETAEAYARQAVASHNVPAVKDTPFEDRGNATLNLAASLVLRRQPEPEEAARLCIEAIAVPEAQRTETVRKRALELSRLLGHWRTNPVVKDFGDRLHGYELLASNPFNAAERRLAHDMVAWWGNFIRAGAPDTVDGTAWPRLDASLGPRARLLSLRAGGRSTPITDARLSAQHQCDFWDALFAPEQTARRDTPLNSNAPSARLNK